MAKASSSRKAVGFTLVEAAVAIGVVAILAGILIPLVLKNLDDARRARARNDLQVIAAAIASQLADTGSRPREDGGPAVGGASGLEDDLWFSGGAPPRLNGVPMDFDGVHDRNNSFVNLFSHSGQAGNALFGLGVAPASAERQYRGPYLGRDMAQKSDPWGHAYLILGYNAQGLATGGPIWVVSAGEGGEIDPANEEVGGPGSRAPAGTPHNQHVAVWAHTGASRTNLAVRVN